MLGAGLRDVSSATPYRGRGVGAGLGTSVTATRMTDAYEASTLRVLPRCPPHLVYDYLDAQMRHPPLLSSYYTFREIDLMKCC